MQLAHKAGIEKALIDVAILDVPSIGLAAQAIRLVKEEFGLPVGGAPSNAILAWKHVKEFGDYAGRLCSAGSAVIMQSLGANFIFYGPIAKSVEVFPACAMADAIIAYAMKSMV